MGGASSDLFRFLDGFCLRNDCGSAAVINGVVREEEAGEGEGEGKGKGERERGGMGSREVGGEVLVGGGGRIAELECIRRTVK